MTTREWLELTVSLALTAVRRSLRRAYAEKPTGISDPAKEEIAAAVAAAVEREFAVTRREREHAATNAPTTAGSPPAL